MHEQPRAATADSPQPFRCPCQSAAHALVLSFDPLGQVLVNFRHHRIQCATLKATIVLRPASHDGIDAPGDLLKSDRRSPLQIPSAHALAYRLGRLCTYRRLKSKKDLPASGFGFAGLECVAQKVKADFAIVLLSSHAAFVPDAAQPTARSPLDSSRAGALARF